MKIAAVYENVTRSIICARFRKKRNRRRKRSKTSNDKSPAPVGSGLPYQRHQQATANR